jgi:hypothetical protein
MMHGYRKGTLTCLVSWIVILAIDTTILASMTNTISISLFLLH